MAIIAVVDIGKTNAKLALVDSRLRKEIEVLTTTNSSISSKPYLHFDTDKLWSFILDSLTSVTARFDVSAISVTTHGACAVLLDKHGDLAAPVLDYEDNRPDECADSYKRIKPPFGTTGSPRLPGGLNVGAQLFWQFQQDTTLHERVRTIVMYPQYWAYRLCGVLANEPTSLGCHTDLWEPVNGEYSVLVDQLNIREKMANVQLASTQLGTILPDVAKKTGLVNDVAVYCGIHDSNASLYTHLKTIEPPFAVVSSGTWVVCMAPGSILTNLNDKRDTLFNVSALGEPTPSSRFMGGREYDQLVQHYSAEQTDEVSKSVIESGACILPAVESTSGPYQHNKYQWSVDPVSLTAQERYNVISFYLAMMTDTCLGLCGATGNIIIEGPFAGNKPYCAMLSAATGRAVLNADGNTTGTSVGAALLAHEHNSTDVEYGYNELANPTQNSHLVDYCKKWRILTEGHATI